MADRGVYEHPGRGRQLLRFDGMRFLNTITPTDIDAMIEVKDTVLVFFEVKLREKGVPMGQRIALERLVKDAKRAGKHAIAIVCEHDVDDSQQDVYLKDLNVREVYTSEKLMWQAPNWSITAKQAADYYIGYFYEIA